MIKGKGRESADYSENKKSKVGRVKIEKMLLRLINESKTKLPHDFKLSLLLFFLEIRIQFTPAPVFFFKKQKLSQLTVHNKMSCTESAIQFLHMIPILDKIIQPL